MSKRIGVHMHTQTPITLSRADQLHICHRTTRLDDPGFSFALLLSAEGVQSSGFNVNAVAEWPGCSSEERKGDISWNVICREI